MTTQELVLSKILNCGTADLNMLNDIDYDLDDIIQDCIDNGDLSLHGIFRGVFYMGAEALQNIFDDKKEEIRETIIELLNEEKKEYIDSGEMTEEELEECEEHRELIEGLELLDSGELTPENDMDYWFNYVFYLTIIFAILPGT